MQVSLLVLILVLATGLEPATGVAAPESPYTITEFIVVIGSAAQTQPDISGDVVVWAEQAGGLGVQDSDVYGIDLKSGPPFAISRARGSQTSPRISGNLVVWEDHRSDVNGDIYAYDLAQKREFAVATGLAPQGGPAVSGNIIVWQDGRNGKSDIYGYDVTTGSGFPISITSYDKTNVRISGNLVVWQAELKQPDGTLNEDVYGYDLTTKQEFAVATGPAFQLTPDVSGRRVVWSEFLSGASERSIHMLDVGTKVESVIAQGSWDHNSPAIAGNLVVWSDNREGKGYDIYGYDIQKNAEFPVSRAIGDQTQPAIDGMRVVWVDNRNQGVGKYDYNPDIYGATLEDRPGPVVPIIGALPEVDAKIEIVWPQGGVAVTAADRANISAYLFRSGSLDIAPCQWWPTIRLWAALNNNQAIPIAVAVPGVRYTTLGALRTWEFNDVDVSAARDPLNRIYFFLAVDGSNTHTNIWSHGADARTYFPQQIIPGGIGVAGNRLDAKIQIVWPHDAQGNPRSVTDASLVNIGVDVFVSGSLLSVPLDWNGTVRLYRSLNNGIEELVAVGQKRLLTVDSLTYPRWDFNNVDVSAAMDPLNKYYFRVAIDSVESTSNIWSHGADGRTYFPNIDVPTSGCT